MPRQPPRRKREHVESVGEAQASMEVKEKRRRTSLVVSERPEQSSSVGSSTHANEAPTASNEELPGLSGLSPEELVHSWERNKPASDTLIQSLKQQLKLCQLEEARAAALVWRCSDSKEKTVQLAQAKDPSLHQIDSIRLNVGGEVFVVPINTLLGREPHSLFHVLLSSSEEGDGLAPVLTDESGAIFIDRDPEIFRLILNYLRGYQHLHLLGSELVEKLRIDARYFLLRGLLDNLTDPDPMGSSQGFQCGPGVSPERNRLRVVYCVAMVGETFFVTGKHSITYEVLVPDYIGVGLVSDACTRHDQEFHKVPNCSIYYMSGVFYTNFPYHRKEENLEKIERGDFITISVDMDKGTAEYVLKNSVKTISLNGARRLRFAVTMKSGSAVRIVSQDEVEAMRRRVDEEAAEVPTRPVLFT